MTENVQGPDLSDGEVQYRCLDLFDYPNLYWRYLGDLQTIRSKFSLDCQSPPEFFPNYSGKVVRSAGRGLEGIH